MGEIREEGMYKIDGLFTGKEVLFILNALALTETDEGELIGRNIMTTLGEGIYSDEIDTITTEEELINEV